MKCVLNIGIADDHSMFRQAIVRVLSDQPEFNVSFQVKDGIEIMAAIENTPTDILILDIVMPGLDGKQVIELITAKHPAIKILVISAQADDNLIAKYVKLGADAFLPKTGEVNELLKAIRSIDSDGFYFTEEIWEMLAKKGISLRSPKKLTQNEIEILKLLCENISLPEIRKKLNLKKTNLGYYKHRIFKKTNTDNIDSLREYAIKHKILP